MRRPRLNPCICARSRRVIDRPRYQWKRLSPPPLEGQRRGIGEKKGRRKQGKVGQLLQVEEERERVRKAFLPTTTKWGIARRNDDSLRLQQREELEEGNSRCVFKATNCRQPSSKCLRQGALTHSFGDFETEELIISWAG